MTKPTKRKPLDPRTLRLGAQYITRRELHASDSWEHGFNSGIRAAARYLRVLTKGIESRTQKRKVTKK